MPKLRKQSESPPPSKWLRSRNGTPFKIARTQQINDADEWLYRADYGDVRGTGLYSVTDLEKLGATFLADQPADWEMSGHRTKESDPWA